MIHTREAVDALRSELAGVDNKVAATRALRWVASQFRPEALTSWEAFRFKAEELLKDWFGDQTKAVVWAVLDAYFGRLAGDRRSYTPPTPRALDFPEASGILDGHS